MTDHIRYDVLARDAMRGVLRRVLEDAAKRGLPGDHHFYITFLTQAENVKLSPRLMQQYPQEMTVILQHQFWDLIVTDDRFEVGLSFGGIPEKLVVPFSAIKSFLDPSVQFALQFETSEAAEAETSDTAPALAKADGNKADGNKADGRKDNKKADARKSEAKADIKGAAAEAKPDDPEHHRPSEGAEVVRLDRFRKK
jgi:hypothetical protein